MNNYRVVCTLHLAAPVVQFSDAFSVPAKCVPSTKHQRTLLNRALEAYGGYRTSRYLRPDSDELGIDVIERKNKDMVTFDILHFYDFIKKLNGLCNETSHLKIDEEEFNIHSNNFSESNNVDVKRVRRAVETANLHRTIIRIIEGNGEVIELGIPPNGSSHHQESTLVDVAGKNNFVRVISNKRKYKVVSSVPLDIKRGDKIRAFDVGPAEQWKCITAESADLIPCQEELGVDVHPELTHLQG